MPNRLQHETSPYLRQHAENPVDWYPWGEEALQRARKEDRPIILSVGYSACHWCHVMAHESFEDPEIARRMNDWFVNVKLDREERPDLDQIYQGVVALLGRGGGWPLTVFLLPDLRPFFGGTYFPKTDRYGMPGFGRLQYKIGIGVERLAKLVAALRRAAGNAVHESKILVRLHLVGLVQALVERALQLARGFGVVGAFVRLDAGVEIRLSLLPPEYIVEGLPHRLDGRKFAAGQQHRRGEQQQGPAHDLPP